MDANSHKDALQPGNWVQWMRLGVRAVVTSPFFAMLDLAVPLMVAACEVVMVHVPGSWTVNAPEPRATWLAELTAQGRVQFVANLPKGNAGREKCCWMCIFRTRELKQEVMRSTDLVVFC